MAHRTGDFPSHQELLPRLRRIEGQVRGVYRMVESRRYCIDILQQVTAARRALDEVALQIMRGHIDACVSDAIRGKGGSEKVEELMHTIHRFVK